ncbi:MULTISPECIES: hypothetical protein [Thermus]|uniref:hypothetical protein n=1 Tax=Thermus TaxID=270 RepID=UPI0005709D9E|nr:MULTISPECIES: hypothetical protein [Thermus]
MGGFGLDLEAAKERYRGLLVEAQRERLLRPLRTPWRGSLARLLRLLAERLAPQPVRWDLEEARHGG